MISQMELRLLNELAGSVHKMERVILLQVQHIVEEEIKRRGGGLEW